MQVRTFTAASVAFGALCLAAAQVVHVSAHKPYNDPYTGYYSRGRMLTFSGRVTGIQVVRQPGTTDSDVTLLVRNRDGGGTAVVELGPQWYVDNQVAKIRTRDNVQVTGSKVLVSGRGIILASQIVVNGQGGPVLALRRPGGDPYWVGAQVVSNSVVPTGGNVVEGTISGFSTYLVDNVPYADAVLKTNNGYTTIDLGPQWYYGRQNVAYRVGDYVSVVAGPNPIVINPNLTVLPTYGVYSGTTVYTVRYGNGQPAYFWHQP